MQQIAEAWTRNPQQFAEAMQSWTQQIGEMNTRIWQEFLDCHNSEDSGEDAKILAELPYFKWIREYYEGQGGCGILVKAGAERPFSQQLLLDESRSD